MLKELEKVVKAIADKNRLRILKMLQQKSMCVCEIREILDITQPSVSKHLKILKDAGFIEDTPESLWTNYALKPQNVYTRTLVPQLSKWLNQDSSICQDLAKVKKVNRKNLYVSKAKR